VLYLCSIGERIEPAANSAEELELGKLWSAACPAFQCPAPFFRVCLTNRPAGQLEPRPGPSTALKLPRTAGHPAGLGRADEGTPPGPPEPERSPPQARGPQPRALSSWPLRLAAGRPVHSPPLATLRQVAPQLAPGHQHARQAGLDRGGASPQVYAAPISRSSTTILGDLKDDSDRRKEDRVGTSGMEDPEDSYWGACGEGFVRRRMPHAARSLSWLASPITAYPGLRTVRHALCYVVTAAPWAST
jgi:hypothetical protein